MENPVSFFKSKYSKSAAHLALSLRVWCMPTIFLTSVAPLIAAAVVATQSSASDATRPIAAAALHLLGKTNIGYLTKPTQNIISQFGQ